MFFYIMIVKESPLRFIFVSLFLMVYIYLYCQTNGFFIYYYNSSRTMSSYNSQSIDQLSLSAIINMKLPLKQILKSKHIFNKVKANTKLFAKFLNKNQVYLNELMSIGFTFVKNQQQDTKEQREICHIALQIMTLQEQCIAELFVGPALGSIKSIESCSSDSDKQETNGTYQSIYQDQQTGQIVVSEKQFSFIDPKQFQKTDNGNHLLELLNYLFENSSDEVVVNYIISVLKSILKVHMANNIYQFLCSQQGNGCLEKLLNISYYFSVSSFLVQLLTDSDVIEEKKYLLFQQTIVDKTIVLMKNSLLDSDKFTGYENFMLELFNEHLTFLSKNEDLYAQILQFANSFVKTSLIEFFLKILLQNSNSQDQLLSGTQSNSLFKNSLSFLSNVCNFLIVDERQKDEQQQYGYQKKPQRAKYDFHQIYKNFLQLCKRIPRILSIKNRHTVLTYLSFLSDVLEHKHFPVILQGQQQLLEIFTVLINQFFSKQSKGIILFTLEKLITKTIQLIKKQISRNLQPPAILSESFKKLNLLVKSPKQIEAAQQKVAFAQKLAIIMASSFPGIKTEGVSHLIQIQEKQKIKLNNFSPTKYHLKFFPHLQTSPQKAHQSYKNHQDLPNLKLNQKPHSSPPKILNIKKMDSMIQIRKQKVKCASQETNSLSQTHSKDQYTQNEFKLQNNIHKITTQEPQQIIQLQVQEVVKKQEIN